MPRAVAQLASYFAGERQGWTGPRSSRRSIAAARPGSSCCSPYGTTTTYGELAQQVDESLYPAGLETYKRARLVGAAIGRTPTPILVPCHRVIGADGSLTGYGGGLHRKQALLELESRRR